MSSRNTPWERRYHIDLQKDFTANEAAALVSGYKLQDSWRDALGWREEAGSSEIHVVPI